jgi:biotin carboxyl carrier protein
VVLGSTVEISPTAPAHAPRKERPAEQSTGERSDFEGLTPVTAPVVGVFYSRPAPNEPPYVDVGTVIELGMTLAVIEVMKVFSSVNATVGGVIARVLVEDGQAVEYGQPLFLVQAQAE